MNDVCLKVFAHEFCSIEGSTVIAHYSTHQGIKKTKALLREKVWWPTMDHDVEDKIRHCHA